MEAGDPVLPSLQITRNTDELFFCIASIAWHCLALQGRKAIRATARAGLQLHDKLCTRLKITLLAVDDDDDDAEDPPDDGELAGSLGKILARGARPQEVAYQQTMPRGPGGVIMGIQPSENQLLAVLRACSAPSVTSVALHDEVPFTLATAVALSSLFPNLTCLDLDMCDQGGEWREAWGLHADTVSYSVSHMLALLGPRLRTLKLSGLGVLPSAVLQPLQLCTALQELRLDHVSYGSRAEALHGASCLLRAVASVTSLRSLHLNCGMEEVPDASEALPYCDRSPACLSALTGLTSLYFDLSYVGDSYVGFQLDEASVRLWDEQWRALVAALRGMPGLQSLSVPRMEMEVRELACLTTLTRVAIQELHLARPVRGPVPDEEQARAAVPAAAVSLPQLSGLHLRAMPSPRVLAALCPQLPLVLPGPTPLAGFAFVEADTARGQGHKHVLLPGGARSVSGAVPALQAWLQRAAGATGVRTLAVGTGHLLLGRPHPWVAPPPGDPLGHGRWLRELGPLALQELDLQGLALEADDLLALVESLPGLQVLRLSRTQFPLASLPSLSRLSYLEALSFHLRFCEDVTSSTLRPALVLTCLNTPSLKRIVLGVVTTAVQHWLPDAIASVRSSLARRNRQAVEIQFG